MGRDQFVWFHAQCLSRTEEVRFVLGEEFEHCCLNLPLCQPFPQYVGRQSGQRKEAPCPVVIGEHPAERAQRQGLRLPIR